MECWNLAWINAKTYSFRRFFHNFVLSIRLWFMSSSFVSFEKNHTVWKYFQRAFQWSRISLGFIEICCHNNLFKSASFFIDTRGMCLDDLWWHTVCGVSILMRICVSWCGYVCFYDLWWQTACGVSMLMWMCVSLCGYVCLDELWWHTVCRVSMWMWMCASWCGYVCLDEPLGITKVP